MGGLLGWILKSVGRNVLEHPAMSFALSSVGALGTILAIRRTRRLGAGRPYTRAFGLNEERVRLPDGRCVAIASHGDPRGRPLFLFHGIPVSRLGHEFTDAPAKEWRVRVLCPDRPGIGLSDPKPDRTLSGYADDVADLADALGIERFAVLGLSGGGPYALACGAKLRNRVSAVVVLAGVGPLDRPGAREGLSKTDLRLIDLSLNRPLLAQLLLTVIAWAVRFAPSVVLKSLADELSEPDRRFLEEEKDKLGAAGVMTSTAEAFKQGAGGVVLEYRLCGLPWGFTLEEVHVPVHLWQGEDDRMTPVHHAENMAIRLPYAELHVLPRTGHLALTDHFGAVLDAMPTN